jgi:hypothetical protein
MPRLAGVRERRHQPFYDHLIRTTGDPTPAITSSTRLFGNSNVGQLALTNLSVAGQLASDQTFVALALRALIFFDGTNARANYQNVMSQLFFTLTLGDKPQFVGPCWYFPQGGGVYSGGGDPAAAAVYNNGLPGQSEIMKLARPIIFPVRQNFNVNAEFFATGSTSALDGLNSGATDDQKIIGFMIDGLQTRDVQ